MSRHDGWWSAEALARQRSIDLVGISGYQMSGSVADILRQERPIYRRYVTIQSALMKALCVVFTAAILLILAFITFYLLANGFKYLSWNIFTQVPIPVGMEGSPGGLKNALVGTLILIGLASAIGIPLGV